MKKMLIAFCHEFLNNIRQKGFLIALFSLPLFIGFTVGLGLIMSSQENNKDPVGYVDFSGVFANQIDFQTFSDSGSIKFIHFEGKELAYEALNQGKIQAYFMIPEDYHDIKEFDLVYLDEPGENAISEFYDFLQLNILSSFSPAIRERVALGTNAVLRTPDGTREFPDNQPSVSTFLPLIVSLGFVLLLLTSSGYLMSGFLDEKANRTIELVITSLSPAQFVSSKLLTMVAIGITMLITWIVVAVIAIYIGGSLLGLSWLQGLEINLGDLLTVVAVGIPSYIFAAAIMMSAGMILGDKQEAESVGPLLFLVAFIPLWLLATIANDIDGPVAIGLSFVPIAAQMTIGIRSMFIQVPIWQVLASVAVQLILVAGVLWLAVTTFRIGLLRAGDRIRLKELFTSKDRLSHEGDQ
jgi:ABC-2 type transport system permease protein